MNVALILAGGKGTRMGIVDRPKQFIDVYNKPIVVHTIESFDVNPEIDAIAVVCLDDWHEDLEIWVRRFELSKVRWIITAGKTRQESVFNGLNELRKSCNDDDIILIHDAARPLVSQRVIADNIQMAKLHGAVDTVIPTADTVVNSKDSTTISNIPNRAELYLGQTPQSFDFLTIYNAHAKAGTFDADATDDCQLVLRNGGQVHLVEGDRMNFKITKMEDVTILKAIIKMGSITRVEAV